MEKLPNQEASLFNRGLNGFRRAIDTYRPVTPQKIAELSELSAQILEQGRLFLVDAELKYIFIKDADPTPPTEEAFKVMFSQGLEDRFRQTTQVTEWGVTADGSYESHVRSVRDEVEGPDTVKRWTQNQGQAMIAMAQQRLAEPAVGSY